VKILTTALETTDIRLTRSISTANGSLGDRSGVSLRLETAEGIGFGASAPIPGSSETGALETLAAQLRSWTDGAVGRSVDELLDDLDTAGLAPLARFAAHTALADLASRGAGAPLHHWLRAGSTPRIRTNALVSDDEPKAVHAAVQAHVAAGATAVKLKVAATDTSTDATRIIAASEACGPDVELRLDANGGWTFDDAVRVIGRVGRHRIAYVEDPTADPVGFGSVAEATGVAMAHDVGPADADDLPGVLERTGATVLVVKAAAAGGIDRVLDAARAIDESHRLIVSSSIDDPIALLAGLHAAAALPGDEAHGLGTASLVRRMPTALEPVGGTVLLPDGPGLGHPVAEATD